LTYCANQRLPEMRVEEFVGTLCVDDLSNSECLSGARRKAMRSHGNAGVNYKIAPDLNIADAVLTLRSWIFRNDVPNIEDWQWGTATQNGEWIGVPWCKEVTPARQRKEGLETVRPDASSGVARYHSPWGCDPRVSPRLAGQVREPRQGRVHP
jgi:hypothetical protein